MTTARLAPEEQIGLVAAVVLHVALVAAIMLRPALVPPPPPVERVEVSLADEVGLTSAAPDPVPESRAAMAPVLAPEPAPPVVSQPTAAPPPAPVPRPRAAPPAPAPRPVATRAPPPRPVATRAPAQPRQTASPAAQPQRASTDPRRRPDKPQSQRVPPKPGGASRIGSDFLPGAGASATSNETRIPASQIGASAKASLFAAIARQLRPRWQPPSGVDVDKLSTKIVFRLNPDGTLLGSPQVLGTTGITDANRAQVQRHQEQAVRAVRLAAPFKLPPEYYEAWKKVGPLEFDWRLAQ